MASSKNLPTAMGFSDEDRYTLFRLPPAAYPRYEYFRDILKDFHPRLIKTIDKLPNGLRNSDDLPSLVNRIGFLTSSDHLEIQVIGPGNTRISLEQLVKDHKEYEDGEHRQSIHFADAEGWNDSEANMKPLIVIYTMSSLDIPKFEGSERRQWLKNRFKCCHPIFFIRDRTNDKKEAILAYLQNVLQDDFKIRTMRKTVIFQSEKDALPTVLSQTLEELCVKAFVHIEMYICSLTKVSSLRGNISTTLDELFRDFKMSIKRMLEDEDLFEICLQKENRNRGPAISSFRMCLADRIAILLSSKLVLIFKIPGPAIHSFMYASRLREETNDILLNLKNLEILLDSRCKDDETNLTNNTTLHLSESEKGFVGTSIQSNILETQKETQQQMTTLDAFVDELLNKLKEPITLRIIDIKHAQPTIQTLKRLHFEVEGILKETSVHLCTDQELREEWSKVPCERWKQALQKKLKGVKFTTETVFGKFCIFIHDSEMKEPEEKIKEKIKKVLSTFPYEYEVKITDLPRLLANGNDVKNMQQNIHGVLKMGMYCESEGKKGTIGLFLKEKNEPNNLFFVTSAHLVPNQGQEVQACTGGHNWVNLGKARVVIPAHVNLIDITAVEVLESMRHLCRSEIEDERSRIVRARVFDTNEGCCKLLQHGVHKKGAQTGVTRGIISSVCGPNHLYVSPTPGSGLSFAEAGDSGAIVCFNTPDRDTQLLSMIMGEDSGRPKTVLDSESLNISLPDVIVGAEGGEDHSLDNQLIFTTLLDTGLKELKARQLDLQV